MPNEEGQVGRYTHEITPYPETPEWIFALFRSTAGSVAHDGGGEAENGDIMFAELAHQWPEEDHLEPHGAWLIILPGDPTVHDVHQHPVVANRAYGGVRCLISKIVLVYTSSSLNTPWSRSSNLAKY